MQGGRPLEGLRVVVTRPEEQAEELARLLFELGAVAVSFPVLEVLPPADPCPLDSALRRLGDFDWVAFASANAVRFAFERYSDLGLDPDLWRRPEVAAVGEATAAALRDRGVRVSVVPEKTDASGVVEALAERGIEGRSVLVLQARQGRPVLEEGLRKAGANVTRVEAYETAIRRPPAGQVEALIRDGWDAVAFTSPSTARNFRLIVEEAGGDPALAPAFCIGAVTEREARSLGYKVGGVAARASAGELVEALRRHFEQERPPLRRKSSTR